VWKEPLLRAVTLILVINTALYFPLISVIFPAWFVFENQSAQALGAIIGGLLFTLISTRVSPYKWFILANIMMAAAFSGYLFVEPGSPFSIVLSFVNGLVGAGLAPIIFTAYRGDRIQKCSRNKFWNTFVSVIISWLGLKNLFQTFG